jgi:type I restriction enzyme S subunit
MGVPALVEDAEDDIVSGYHLTLLRPFLERVSGGDLFRAPQSRVVAYQFCVGANCVTRYGFSPSAIKSVWLPFTALTEQAAVVSFLDRATADINLAIESAQRETALLRKYRTRLVADVVTGKLDVREAAARLPDGVAEHNALDEAYTLFHLGRSRRRPRHRHRGI